MFDKLWFGSSVPKKYSGTCLTCFGLVQLSSTNMIWFKFSKEIFWAIFDMFWFRFKRPKEIFRDIFSKEIFWDIFDMFWFRLKRCREIFWDMCAASWRIWSSSSSSAGGGDGYWAGQRAILQAAHITTAQAMLCIVVASYHSHAIACIWKSKMRLIYLPINVVYMCILKYKRWIVVWYSRLARKLTRIRGKRMLGQLKCLFKSNRCYLPLLSVKLRGENQSLSFWFSRWYLVTLFDSAKRIWGHDNILAIWVAFLCKHVIRLLRIDCDFKMIGLLAYSRP